MAETQRKKRPAPSTARKWLAAATSRKWLFFDNDGSFEHHFDWVPRHLRVGPWSLGTYLFLVTFSVCLLTCAPSDERPPPVALPTSSPWLWVDVSIFAWGSVVLGYIAFRGYLSVLAISYTGLSWLLLTLRAGFAAFGSLLSLPLLLRASEALRFTALAQATVTFAVWNFVLLPVIYKLHCTGAKQRADFIRWNFSFTLVQIHLLNLPMALANVVVGAGARPFVAFDLYLAFVPLFAYALFYVLILDRVGVHLYPIFSPRLHYSVIGYSSLFVIYYGCYHCYDQLIHAPEGQPLPAA